MSCALGGLGEVAPAKVISYCQISFGSGDWEDEDQKPSFWKADLLLLRSGEMVVEYFCGEDEWDFQRVTECPVEVAAEDVPGVPDDVARALKFLLLAAAPHRAGSTASEAAPESSG